MEAIKVILLMGLLLLLSVLPPFIIGVVLKAVLRKRDLPRYLPFILAVVIGIILYFINGKSPIIIFKSNLFGLVVFMVI